MKWNGMGIQTYVKTFRKLRLRNPAPQLIFSPVSPSRSEKFVLFLIGIAQFVNVLEFMMVMPLGPDLAADIGIPLSKLGWMGSSYTAAASVAGFFGVMLLARVPRRRILCVSLSGLALGTIAGGFARDTLTLLISRVAAGVFGGPATSATIGLVADYIPEARRGKAMGAVMSAVSIAAVLGVPFSLKLSEFGGWRAPFFAVGMVTAVTAALALFLMPQPPEPSHANAIGNLKEALTRLFSKKRVWMSYATTSFGMMSGFLVIPNLAAFVQGNMGFPRGEMGELYFVGGIFSFASMRYSGRLVDRYGSARVGTFASAGLIALLWLFFYRQIPLSPFLFFIAFMPILSARNVSFQTLNSKVPDPHERSMYMSALSSINHVGSAGGAFIASQLLSQNPDGTLVGMPRVALLSMAFGSALVPLLWAVEKGVTSRTLLIENA